MIRTGTVVIAFVDPVKAIHFYSPLFVKKIG